MGSLVVYLIRKKQIIFRENIIRLEEARKRSRVLSEKYFFKQQQQNILTLNGFSATASEWISLESSVTRARWNMIHNIALCVSSTNTWTWISAMLSNASSAARTIWVVNAFRATAIRIRIANIWWNASALGLTIANRTLWIFSTWRRVAWIGRNNSGIWYPRASDERISLVSRRTRTMCWMTDDMTFGICSTCSDAGILTFFAYACLIVWAIVAEYALWPTVWWTANVVGNAWAYRSTLLDLAYRVGAAWWRWARVFWLATCAINWNWMTRNEWVTSFTGMTATDWIVIENFASCAEATCSWAWINAFKVNAGLVLCTFWAVDTFRLADRWTSAISGDAWANGVSGWG